MTMPMEPLNLNMRWCRAIVTALQQAGVTHAVVCMGGRSTAMALTLTTTAGLETVLRVDERSAAFLALGLARCSGRPVAVCTTSGSAVANLLPALCEAEATGTPLVLLTCDRPGSHRAGGGPQIADHMGLCAALVAAAVDLPEPADGAAARDGLARTLADLLRHTAPGPARGPVHINVPQHGWIATLEPDATLPPAALADRWPETPVVRRPVPDAAAAPGLVSDVGDLAAAWGLRPGLRGLVVVGPFCPLPPGAVAALAGRLGFPVLADAASGLRRPAVPNLVALGDVLAVAAPQMFPEPPELILHLGPAPTTFTLHNYLKAQGSGDRGGADGNVPVLRIVDRPIGGDFLYARFRQMVAPGRAALDALAAALGPGDPAWLAGWLAADRQLAARRDAVLTTLPWNDAAAAAAACAAPGYRLLYLANSMPSRLGNLFCGGSDTAQDVLCNRGVNGIDGNVASFLGALLAGDGPGLLLIGDQTMLYDLPALEALPERRVSGCICIVNNGGPGIYDVSVWTECPQVRPLLRRETTVDFGAIAAGFGLPFTRCTDRAGLDAALAAAARRDGLSVVEAVVPGEALATNVPHLVRAMLGMA